MIRGRSEAFAARDERRIVAPRCTPSASTAYARLTSSLTMNVMPWAAQRSRSTSACARRRGGDAILCDYWTAAGAAGDRGRHPATSSSVPKSGVSAYSPAIVALMAMQVRARAMRVLPRRSLRVVVARPE